MNEFEPNTMAGRIEKRLKHVGISAAAASEEATGKKDAIRKIYTAARDGAEFSPRTDTLAGLARVLRTTMDYLRHGTGPEDIEDLDSDAAFHQSNGETLGIIEAGIVEAGAFRSVDALHIPENAKRIPMQPDPRYIKATQLAWQARGDSMTKARIFEGTWVIGAVYNEYIQHYGDAPSGSYFIVQRSRYGGSENEITVKEVRFYRDHFELVPHSENPEHQIITIPYNQDGDTDEMKIDLVAVVIGSYNAFGR